MSAITDLQAAVDANTQAVNAAVSQLQKPGVDPAAVATLTGQLLSNNRALNDALAQASVAGQ